MKKHTCLIGSVLFAVSISTQAETFVFGNASLGEAIITTTGTVSVFPATASPFGPDFFGGEIGIDLASPPPAGDLAFFGDSVPSGATLGAPGSSFADAATGFSPLGGTPPPVIGSSSTASATGSGDAFAFSFGAISFDVDGIGTVAFDIPVEFTAEVLDPTLDTAPVALSASAFASITSGDGDLGFAELVSPGGLSDFSTIDVDVFSFAFDIDGPDTISILFDTSAIVDTGVSGVPLPAAAWFFITALLGLGGLKRKQLRQLT